MYFPVLKSKATTFRALSKLKPESKRWVNPIIEVMQHGDDSEQPQRTIEKLKESLEYLIGSEKVFIDPLYFPLKGFDLDNFYGSLFETSSKIELNLYPVINLLKSPEHLRYYLANPSQMSECAFRIQFRKLSPKEIPTVIKLMQEATKGKALNDIYIFLDAEDVSDGTTDFIFSAMAIISALKDSGFNNIVFISGSFPGDLSAYKNITGTIPRLDKNAWKDVMEATSLSPSELYFGDYTIRDIEPPYEGFSPNIIPTLRYTIDSEFYISRGISSKFHSDGMRQFNELCKKLIEEPFYRGQEFSWGDNEIFLKATDPNSTSGNQASWAQIGINQHVEFVVFELLPLFGT